MKRWVYASLALTLLCLALSLALGLIPSLYERLPEKIPTHWGFNGEPDGWVDKADWKQAFLLLPMIMLGLLLLFVLLPWLSPRGFSLDRFRPTFGYIIFLVMAMLAYIQVVTVLGGVIFPNLDSRLILGGICLFFALLGNVMGKVKRNFYVGIRTPWTLASEKVWTATHRLGAWMFTAAGLIGFAIVLLGAPVYFALILILPAALVPVVYSLVLYKKLEREGRLDIPAPSEEVPVG